MSTKLNYEFQLHLPLSPPNFSYRLSEVKLPTRDSASIWFQIATAFSHPSASCPRGRLIYPLQMFPIPQILFASIFFHIFCSKFFAPQFQLTPSAAELKYFFVFLFRSIIHIFGVFEFISKRGIQFCKLFWPPYFVNFLDLDIASM